MGTLRGHSIYEVRKLYGQPLGVIGGRIYEVQEVYGYPRGQGAIGTLLLVGGLPRWLKKSNKILNIVGCNILFENC